MQMDCPKCRRLPLVHCRNEFGNFWHCERCDGTAVTLPLLRRMVGRDTINALWQGARQRVHPERCSCPGCKQGMEEVPIQTPVGPRLIDVCSHCQFVWLDAGEWDDLPMVESEEETPRLEMPLELRERIAVQPIEKIREDYEADRSRGPDQFWQWVPALLGMPSEVAQPNSGGRPWMTWMTAVFIGLMSLVAFMDLPVMIARYGLIPAEWSRGGGLTLLTSFFLHGGILHLIGNLYFLLMFGDNTENELGSGAFILLLLSSLLMGHLVHILFDPQSTIPCVGASGGISGVIAFYALRFPNARLNMAYWIVFYPIWYRIRAIWAFGFWILLQLFISWQQIGGFSHVSGGAHLGGALMGFTAWLVWRSSQPDRSRTTA